MSNKTDLLPCPFREHKRKKLVIHHRKHRCLEDGLYAVKCEICGIRGPYALSEEKAVEKWNTRHAETCENVDKYPSERFTCSKCGCKVYYEDYESNPYMFVNGIAEVPRFCPNCGKVVRR